MFVDESHFSNEPYVQRGWFLIGEKKKAPTPKKVQKKTIIGGLNLKTQKFYWKQSDKGNSKIFIEFLYQLRQSFPNKMIILILDNSSIHKSKKVQEFLKHNPWVKLKLLAPSSPEYNPIERFWLWLKEKCMALNLFAPLKKLLVK